MSDIIRRSADRSIGLFIDGVSLDRATRKIGRRIQWKSFKDSLSQGRKMVLANYYTVIPFEDDARQHSFLDAVERAGFNVNIKRLPPKGIDRQVTSDVEVATDLVSFSISTDNARAILVCPSRDLAYPLRILADRKIECVIVDFGTPQSPELMKAASNWIDLSTTEGIWL